MKRLLVVLVAALPIVACGKNSTPVAPTVEAAPDGSYAVAGTVMAQREAGTIPLAGAEVIASNGRYSRTVRTDENGGFVLDRLTSGDWTISVLKKGYLSDAKLVTVDGSDASVSFELSIDDSPDIGRPQPASRLK